MQALIKELAIKRVEHSHANGTEKARLLFTYVLEQKLAIFFFKEKSDLV